MLPVGDTIRAEDGKKAPKKNLIHHLLKHRSHLHFSLIDPDNQSAREAGSVAKRCEILGTDGILVGGTTVPTRKLMYDTIASIKKRCDLPIILFPNSASTVPENLDYILFMMLINATDEAFFRGEQVKGAPLIKQWDIQPISTGYIIVSTSEQPTTVERHVPLDKITVDDIDKAVHYAMYTEMSGMSCVYFEAGSGAEQPISNEMIKTVRQAIDIPIIVGGGIRDADIAAEKIHAGADIIVTGTVIEKDEHRLQGIIDAIHSKK